MKNNFLQEILVSVALVVLLVFMLNPFDFWMPSTLLMMLIAVFVAIFGSLVSFIWRENSKDEREILHKSIAGRAAFLAGASVLVVGIVVQSFSHTLDPWLAIALGVMILAKIAGLAYGRMKH